MFTEQRVTGTGCRKCISWTAIFAGAFVAVGLGFLLHLFTSGLGLSLFAIDATGLTILAIGTFIWLFVASFFIMFASGFVAGALGRTFFPSRCHGALHGFLAWCVGLVFAIILATHVSLGTMAFDGAARTAQIQQVTPVTKIVTIVPNKATEKTANHLGMGVLAVFFIFFIGAVGSTVGGYVGAQFRGHEPEEKV